MIWRPKYRDRIIESPTLSPVDAAALNDRRSKRFPISEITLGAFGEEGARELAMWRRLIETSVSKPYFCLWLNAEPSFLASALPKSVQEKTYFTDDKSWITDLEAAPGELTFAILTNAESFRLALLGLPTEDGLSRLAEFVNG